MSFEKKRQILVDSIRVPLDATESAIIQKAREKMKRAGLPTSTLHFRLYKKSVDARRREEIRFVCSAVAEGEIAPERYPVERLRRADARLLTVESLSPVAGDEELYARPLVVGMGPAGLFAALLLAREGYAPLLIDRGGDVKERTASVERFHREGVLNVESNVQFGAGGAGTFSDGKLITRINDPRCGFVLETLVEAGAPEEILTRAKPHVGTDLLREVVDRMLSRIVSLGGEIRYHCRMEDFSPSSEGGLLVDTSCGRIHCGAMILAPGHSARDTYVRLLEKNFAIEPKPISVGVRAEHLQVDIDTALYGDFAGDPRLGPAEYSLSDTRGERGVYTFCMCPGGEVVAAASEEGGLVVNGMSHHARNGRNANAAVAVSVGCEDYAPVEGSRALGAIEFQRSIERAAYAAGGGEYVAPVMTLGDFLEGKRGTEPSRVQPSYRGGRTRVGDFSEVFPSFVVESLRYGFRSFGKKLSGYDAPDTVLTAAETRTSAPLRLLRNGETLTAVGQDRIYPCGEGAGYAGGITSAAVDGLRVAEALISRFARPREVKGGF